MNFFILLAMLIYYPVYSRDIRQFEQVVNEIERTYSPLASKASTEIKVNWFLESSIVNVTGGIVDNKWVISIYGGAVKNPRLSVEAFRFILCHEMGHIVGGSPYFNIPTEQRIPDRNFLFGVSNSGQPDYYGAAVCMKLLLKQRDNSSYGAQVAAPHLNHVCENGSRDRRSQDLCRRIGSAGMETLNFLKVVFFPQESLAFETPSLEIARATHMAHPKLQCRLDTILAGASCQYNPRGTDPTESETMNDICEQNLQSARPLCWYAD